MVKDQQKLIVIAIILVTWIAIALITASFENVSETIKIEEARISALEELATAQLDRTEKNRAALHNEILEEALRSDANDDLLNEAINQLYDDVHPAIEATEKEGTGPCFEALGKFKIVGYYKGGNGLTTATGVTCQAGITVAVDPKIIPYGTHLWIEGIGHRIAQDCGGFRGKVLDVFWKTEKECYSWNTTNDPHRKVWVIKNG